MTRPGVPLLIPGIGSSRGKLAQKAYARAVFRLDARYNPAGGAPTDLSPNALPVQNGSTSGADTNDVLFLPAPQPSNGTPCYVYLPAGGTNTLSAPDEAALDITGDIDLRAYVNLESWTAGSDDRFVAKLGTAGQHSYRIRMTGGSFRIEWSPNGTSVLNLATSPGWPANVWRWVRATLDVDNGAGGHEAKFYTSTVPDPGPADWMLVDTKVGVGTTSIFAGTNTLFCGYTQPAMVGRMQVRNGIDGPVVFDWSAENPVNATHTSFTASTGQTVTVNRATTGRKTVVVQAPKWLLGGDDYIEVADNNLLDLDAATSFTVIGVLRQHATAVSDGPWISKRATAGTGTGWGVRTNGATLVAHVGVEDTGTDEQTRTTTALTAGALSMVGFVVDRTAGTIAAVRNGALTATASMASVGDCSNALPMRIGRQADGTVYQDFENYSWYVWREALTASELAAIAADWGIA